MKSSISQQLRDLYGAPAPQVSFEFFPPKSETAEENLWQAITELAPLAPRFVSVTYGAGGSTRERTHATIARILNETTLTPAAHLTCVGASKEDIQQVAQEYWDLGVKHIVALRGDMPDNAPYQPHEQGYHYADDLVKGLLEIAPFEISVAAYPETHPAAISAKDDLEHLKRKLDAGATRAITQFFFDVDSYMRFLDRADKIGITAEIVPGILPVMNVAQLKKFAGMCGTAVPDWMAKLCEGLDENPDMRLLIGAVIAAEQCRMLRLYGVEQFHFYTLNRAELTCATCHMLGLRAKTAKNQTEKLAS